MWSSKGALVSKSTAKTSTAAFQDQVDQAGLRAGLANFRVIRQETDSARAEELSQTATMPRRQFRATPGTPMCTEIRCACRWSVGQEAQGTAAALAASAVAAAAAEPS